LLLLAWASRCGRPGSFWRLDPLLFFWRFLFDFFLFKGRLFIIKWWVSSLGFLVIFELGLLIFILRNGIRWNLFVSLMRLLILVFRRLFFLFLCLYVGVGFLQLTLGDGLLVSFGITLILRRTLISPLFFILLSCAAWSFCIAFRILFLFYFRFGVLFFFFHNFLRLFAQGLTWHFWRSNSLHNYLFLSIFFLLLLFDRLWLLFLYSNHFHIGGGLLCLLDFLHFNILCFFRGLLVFELMVFHILVFLLLSQFCYLTSLLFLFFFIRIRWKVHLAVDCSR